MSYQTPLDLEYFYSLLKKYVEVVNFMQYPVQLFWGTEKKDVLGI